MSLNIATRALCVDLFTKHWSGRKRDTKVTHEITTKYGADASAGNFNKLLVPKHLIERIELIIGKAYRVHYALTMPWGEGKIRITTAKCYFQEYVPQMAKVKTEFDIAVRKFLEMYPSVVAEEAQGMLQGMFNPHDYPTVSQLKEKFDMIISVMPVPTAHDFRLQMNQEQIQELEENWEKESERRSKDAFHHLWERMLEPLQDMVDIEDKKQIRKSLVNNINKICDLVDSLNVWGDESITDMAQRLRDDLGKQDLEGVKDNPIKKAELKKAAKDFINEVIVNMDLDPLSPVQQMNPTPSLTVGDIDDKMSFMK